MSVVCNRIIVFGLSLALALFWGCAQESAAPNGAPTLVGDSDSDYRVEALATVGSEVRTIAFRAAQNVAKDSVGKIGQKDVVFQGGVDKPLTSSTSDLARLALSECGMRRTGLAGGATTANSCLQTQFVSATAWAFTSTTRQGTPAAPSVPATDSRPSCDSGSRPEFLFFQSEPGTCDQVLQYEEVLVCAASKLQELANAEAPTVWPHGLSGLALSPTDGAGSFDIVGLNAPEPHTLPSVTFRIVPPKDKFLVRDLAMELLSYVPLLDQLPFKIGSPGQYRTCSDIYSSAATVLPSGVNAGDIGKAAYNLAANAGAAVVPAPGAAPTYYPPIELNATGIDWPQTAKRHLDMETANLRAAGQLMQDLVTKNVYSAMAGATQKAAGLPPSEKGRAFWADGADGNSVAEISRTLFGRLGTLGFAAYFPIWTNCKKTKNPDTPAYLLLPKDQWNELAPAGLKGRGADLPRKTSKTRNAETLLSASRLIVTSPDTAVVRSAMKASLLSQLVASNAGRPVNELTTQMVNDQVSFLSDENVRTAVVRQNSVLGSLSNQGPSANALATLGATATANPAGLLAGKALVRQTYEGDLMGPLGMVQIGAECTGSWLPGGDWTNAFNIAVGDPLVGGTLAGRSPAGVGPLFGPAFRSYQFNDAFSVGQALRDRLVRLREYGRAVGLPDDDDVKSRAGALFEIQGWAGGTRVIVAPDAAAAQIHVHLFDVNPADFGLTDSSVPSDIAAAFAMAIVPDVAPTEGDIGILSQCLSSTRTTCASTVSNFLWQASSATIDATTFADAAKLGRLGKRYDLVFNTTAGTGVPTVVSGIAGSTSARMIAISKLTKSVLRLKTISGKGQVLATLRSQSASPAVLDHATTAAVSPLRNKLIDGVFGYGKASDDLNSSLADTKDYCIEGVPRDVFVPLENELTSDSDGYENSWKHYLTLAKTSAQKADELGRELIDIGTRIEERKEGAADKIEEAMGGPIDKSCLEDDPITHKRDLTKCNDTLKASLLSDRLDVLLLSEDPRKTTAPAGALPALTFPGDPVGTTAALKTALGCAYTPHPIVCDRLNQPNAYAAAVDISKPFPGRAANTVYYAALGVVKGSTPPTVSECSGTPLTEPLTYLSQPWAANEREGQIRASLNGAKMAVNDQGDFTIHSGAMLILDSSDQTGVSDPLWPGCLRSATPGASCGFPPASANKNAAMNRVFDSVFRTCPGADSTLGTCNSGSGTPAEELTGLRWRVMGAMWTAWSLAGGAPDGALDMPVPATAFPGVFHSNPDSVCTLPITSYGPARFVSATNPSGMPGVSYYKLSGPQLGMSDSDNQIMGFAKDVNVGFRTMALTSPSEMPTWYRAIYNSNGFGDEACWRDGNAGLGYFHFRAQSTALRSDTSTLLEPLNSVPGNIAGSSDTGLNMDGWRNLARNTAHADFPGWLATVKTAFKETSPGMTPYFLYGYDRWGMYSMRYEGAHPRNPFFATPMGDEAPTEYLSHNDRAGGQTIYNEHASSQSDCDFDATGYCAFWPREGLPSKQPPSVRARFFANSLAPKSADDAKRQLAGAASLACFASNVPPVYGDTAEPPPIDSVDDLRLLEAWLVAKEKVAADSVGRLYLEDLPYQVAQLYDGPAAGGGGLKGQMGVVAIEGMQAVRAGGQSWATVAHDVTLARLEIATLREHLRALDAEEKIVNAEQLLRTISHLRDVAMALGDLIATSSTNVGAIGGGFIKLGGAAAAALASTGIETTELVPAQLDKLDSQRREAMLGTSRALVGIRKEQTDRIADVRDKVATAQARFLQLDAMRNALLGNIEKASGAGAWKCNDASSNKEFTCHSYVNTVLNTRYSGTRIRYENALIAARASAYYARRAVEQRLGVRLDDLTANIGPLEAPSKWADRVCTMHGVDFKAIKSEEVAPDPAKKQAFEELRSTEYANSFIGDYVDMLSNFVEYYNVAYPSQDGNDTLLLSMRENVERNSGACKEPGRNRLRSTASLGLASDSSNGDGIWQVDLCGNAETKCADAQQWVLNTPPDYGAATPVITVGVTSGAWLHTRAHNAPGGKPEQGVAAPSGYVSQSVILPSGDYVLSFKDVSVNLTTGVPDVMGALGYRVAVFDELGTAIASNIYTPARSTQFIVALDTYQNAVGTPRMLRFNVPNNGRYRIGFAPGRASGVDGSVVITEPQLERDDGNAPTEYAATDSDGLSVAANCASTPAQLRMHFERKCDTVGKVSAPPRCYYEALNPFVLDSQKLSVNGVSLNDMLAADNFNYRNVDFALNIVGTGARSCDENPTPGCYANGTVEYDLVHEANQVGIVGYDREVRRFDFGEGAIRHAKALTSERYLSLPLSGGDANLLSQTGITKTELRGRPLDGSYRLRIYESPALRWSNVEDVQLMYRYRYWSRVNAAKP